MSRRIEMLAVDGYEGIYSVTPDGQVWSHIRGRFLRSHSDSSGYQFVALYRGARPKWQPKVHILVARAFIPNPNGLSIVNHKNGVKSDNSIDNLEWVTPSENIRHAFRMGLSSQAGSRNAYSKLTEDEVAEIRRMARDGVLQTVLAKRFGVSRPTICGIVQRKTWPHVRSAA